MKVAFAIISCFWFSCINSFNLFAQDALTWKLGNIAIIRDRKEVKIGDSLPDIPALKIVQYKNPELKLSELKGKAIILDFWHQYCTTCIEAFPKLKVMQDEFADSLVILPITFQSEASVKEFFAKRFQRGKPIEFPSIVEDTLLSKYFPHLGNPHEVWIDRKGIVRAITSSLEITNENVALLVREQHLNLPFNYLQLDFQYNKPFLVGNNGGPQDAFVYRSIISPYIDSLPGRRCFIEDSNFTRIFIPNATIISMYKDLLARLGSGPYQDFTNDFLNKRLIIEMRNPERIRSSLSVSQNDYDIGAAFMKSNAFCYELILPSAFKIEAASQMALQDLDRYFHMSVNAERRIIQGMALIKITGTKKLDRSSKPEDPTSYEDGHMISPHITMNQFVSDLNFTCLKLPFVRNETGIVYPVDLDMTIRPEDNPGVIRKELRRYGLDLAPRTFSEYVLVARDKK